MKKARRVAALLLAALLLLPLTGPALITSISAETTQEEIDKLKQEASALDKEKAQLAKELKEIRSDKSKAQQQKNLLEKQINIIQDEIDNIQAQIDQYDVLIVQLQDEISQTQVQEQERYELFCQRIRAMEEEGETSYWAILFSSESFSQLLDNFIMVEEIIEYDNGVMESLVQLRGQLETDKQALEQSRQEQQQARQAQESAQAELESQEGEVDALISEISQKESELKKLEAELKKAADAMDKEIRAKEKELAAQIANVASESGYLWPLDASRNVLSSLYGGRIHPITKKPNNHTGIDIPAPKNSNIYAAKSGVVVTSTYNKSYGNYVVVSHSDGTSTLYAHMNKRGVKEGQTVKQGDVIGYVGTTGSSTGNHLHFEVRVNGSRIDPVDLYKDKVLYARSGGKTVLLKH